MRNTLLYRATFNSGQMEETFFAADDEHASRVAQEIAARQRVKYDAVQRVAIKTPSSGAVVGRIFNQEKK
jgi:hypothetical protein